MFIRKVANTSGNTAIQVVEKKERKNKLIKHVGTARTPLEVDQLCSLAQQFVDQERIATGKISLFDTRYEESELKSLLNRLNFTHVRDTLTYQFFTHFYHTMGFSTLHDDCFEDLVMARIVSPGSKRKTRDMLEYRFGKSYSLTGIYRTLRTVTEKKYQERIERVNYEFVKQYLKQDIAVLFFDVTTLYYEAFDEDDTRKYGFSKEHKNNQPQIVVGLTVTTSGLPLSMQMFEGNTFEGHTMIPCIEGLMKQFSLQDIVIVADSAMLNIDNLTQLEEKKLKYIVGARLGNIPKIRFKRIVKNLSKIDGSTIRMDMENGRVLIVGYSEKRAKKERHDREKQIQKAKEMIQKPSSVVKRYKFVTSGSKKEQYKLNQ